MDIEVIEVTIELELDSVADAATCGVLAGAFYQGVIYSGVEVAEAIKLTGQYLFEEDGTCLFEDCDIVEQATEQNEPRDIGGCACS